MITTENIASPKKSIGKNISTIFVIFLKSTKLIKLIQAVKLFKIAKPMVMIFSMVISILCYSAVWTPEFAIGFVLLLLVHEFGHVVAMNKEGFKTNAPVFIPFVGAMLFSPKDMDRRQESVIGIGGVILGSIACFLLLGIHYFIYPSVYLLTLAYLGLFLNLFQMIPISPLDGGRVTQSIGKNFQFVGILLLIGVTVLVKQPSILLIWILVFFDFTFLSFKQRLICSSIVEVALIFFTCSGIGINDKIDLWVCIIDSIVGLCYVVAIYFSWKDNQEEMEHTFSLPHLRPQLSVKQKLFWLGVFLSTVVILTASLYFLHSTLLPLIENK